ncbi:MAG: energy transducer TonB [Bacteroidales bacterium]|nr:energy transducer TonB [Bacteroidales bacterium]
MTISLCIGIVFICAALITPYLSAKAAFDRGEVREEREVVVEMENLELPSEDFAPPPPPPPPPPTDAVQQQRYVPPVVVDSVSFEEEVAFMTFDEIREEVVDRSVDEVIEIVTTVTTEEVAEEVAEPEPFLIVEEMPMFPGGDAELLKFITENVVYPERAKENNIQGTVYLRFAVTSTGNVGEVQVIRGVDAMLDAAAIDAVKKLPAFRPGRQGGVAVPVWYSVPVRFQLVEL